jgi:hypothetical protein
MTLKQFIKDNNIEEYIRTAELTLDFLKLTPLIPPEIKIFQDNPRMSIAVSLTGAATLIFYRAPKTGGDASYRTRFSPAGAAGSLEEAKGGIRAG